MLDARVGGLSTTTFGGVAMPHALDPHGFSGCVLRTSTEASWTATTGSQGIDTGYADVALP